MNTQIAIFSGRKAEDDAASWANKATAQGYTVHPPSLSIDRQNGKHLAMMATKA